MCCGRVDFLAYACGWMDGMHVCSGDAVPLNFDYRSFGNGFDVFFRLL